MSDVNQTTGAFQAAPTSTVQITAVGAASTRVALTLPPQNSGVPGPAFSQFQLYNAGTLAAHVAFGGATVVAVQPNGATPGDYPVAPGAVVVVTVAGNPTNVAAIASGVSGVLEITPGAGL